MTTALEIGLIWSGASIGVVALWNLVKYACRTELPDAFRKSAVHSPGRA